jgi:hypothetical protein
MDQYFRPAPAQKEGEFNLRCSDQSTGCLVGSCPTTLVWVVLVDHMTVILNMRESSAQNSMYTYLLWIFNLIILQIICIIYIVAFVPGVIDLPLQFFFRHRSGVFGSPERKAPLVRSNFAHLFQPATEPRTAEFPSNSPSIFPISLLPPPEGIQYGECVPFKSNRAFLQPSQTPSCPSERILSHPRAGVSDSPLRQFRNRVHPIAGPFCPLRCL